MSEERFDRLDTRMDSLDTRMDSLDTRMDSLDTRMDSLDTRMDSLDTRMGSLDTRMNSVEGDIQELKADVVGLRRHMGVLHEDVVGRIKALGEDDSLRREMRTGFAELRQMFQNHAVVGDATDRRHAGTLDDHERRIRALEDNRS
jgi:chromosome segregation ATPase